MATKKVNAFLFDDVIEFAFLDLPVQIDPAVWAAIEVNQVPVFGADLQDPVDFVPGDGVFGIDPSGRPFVTFGMQQPPVFLSDADWLP
jgi:hypothetical protein